LSGPDVANPAQIVPGDSGVGQRGGDIHQLHGLSAGGGDVFKFGNAAVGEKRCEPTRMREKLREERELGEKRGAEKLLHAVARIALAHTGDGRVHGDDQRGEAGAAGTINAAFGGGAASQEIKLIPRGTFCSGFHVFQFVAGNGREDVAGARIARGFGGGDFPAGMHQTAVTDGSEQTREGEVESQDADAEIAFVEGYGVARAKEDVVEGTGIFSESGFVVGASIKVVEDAARKASLGKAAKIFDIHYAGRAESVSSEGHEEYITEKRPAEAMRK